jgi:hypothetical protein
MILTRRNFFSVLAAPAIIRVAGIMPVRVLVEDDGEIVWTAAGGQRALVWDHGSLFVANGETITIDFNPNWVSLA